MYYSKMISIFNNQTPNFAALENNNKNKNVSFGIKRVAEMNSTTDNQLGRLYLTDKGIVLQGALIAENRDSLNLSLQFSGNSLKLMSGDTQIGTPVTLNLGSEAQVISEGSTFGTISVNGVDLRVKGLDSAANIFNAGVVGTHTIANDIYIDNDNSISLISNSVLELVGDDIQINSGGNSAVFIGQDPVNNLSTVYLGSENTNDNLVATKGYVDNKTSGAMKFAGTVTTGGFVDKLNTNLFSQQVSDFGYSNGTTIAGVTASSSTKTYNRQSLTGMFLDINAFAQRIADVMTNASSSSPMIATIDASVPNTVAKLIIPTNYTGSDNGSTNAIIKDITLPYSLTVEDFTNIRLAYNSEYGGSEGDHAGATSGVVLYLPNDSGSSLANKTFILGSPVKFENLIKKTNLETGYMFAIEDVCTLITNNNSTLVYPGDFIIMSADKTQNANSQLVASDFVIVRSGTPLT